MLSPVGNWGWFSRSVVSHQVIPHLYRIAVVKTILNELLGLCHFHFEIAKCRGHFFAPLPQQTGWANSPSHKNLFPCPAWRHSTNPLPTTRWNLSNQTNKCPNKFRLPVFVRVDLALLFARKRLQTNQIIAILNNSLFHSRPIVHSTGLANR